MLLHIYSFEMSYTAHVLRWRYSAVSTPPRPDAVYSVSLLKMSLLQMKKKNVRLSAEGKMGLQFEFSISMSTIAGFYCKS